MMIAPIDQWIDRVCEGRHLTREQTASLVDAIMDGRLAEDRLARYLTALSDKGETVEEIVGAAEAMRRHVTRIDCDVPDAIDTCGTGGDGISTFNVSTAAALVAAGAGATVAKHGNRSNSRKSGSAEVLRALGVDIDAPPAVVERCIREAGIGFLFAAKLHPAMKHVASVRRSIGRRTIFNLLGPLTNPAFVTRQIVGVPRVELIETIAGALRELGTVHALVVCGHDGLCDFTITGPSRYVELRDGNCSQRVVSPEEAGLAPGSLGALRIDSPTESAAAIRAILEGEPGPRRDHTVLNAAAALIVAGVAANWAEGVRRSADALDSGAASGVLEKLVSIAPGGDRPDEEGADPS